jgi:hypothetical protein
MVEWLKCQGACLASAEALILHPSTAKKRKEEKYETCFLKKKQN